MSKKTNPPQLNQDILQTLQACLTTLIQTVAAKAFQKGYLNQQKDSIDAEVFHILLLEALRISAEAGITEKELINGIKKYYREINKQHSNSMN